MKFRAIAATTALFLTSFSLQANMDINVINQTGKSLTFVVSEPDGSTSTDSHGVNSGATYNFKLDDLLAKGCDQHQLCHKPKLWIVLEKWGDEVVYLRCAKMFNGKGMSDVNFTITGDDSSELNCAMSSGKPEATK